MKVEVKTLDAGKAGDVELNDAVFGIEPRADRASLITLGGDIQRRAFVCRVGGSPLAGHAAGSQARHAPRDRLEALHDLLSLGGHQAFSSVARDSPPSASRSTVRTRQLRPATVSRAPRARVGAALVG